METKEIEQKLIAKKKTWNNYGLDDRIKKAISKLKWTNPTLVQDKSIPYALSGKDVLAKAKTGSGKTAAYGIPIVQRILNEKETIGSATGLRAVILVPSTELAVQVHQVITDLAYYCSHLVSCLRITADELIETQEPRLTELPDIIVATPGRLVVHLQRRNIDLSKLEMLVVDEADLVMSFGYNHDMETIKGHLPSICQGFLMSATLSEDVIALRNLVLHTPVVIELEEKEQEITLKQYSVPCSDQDKYLLLYVLMKLKLLNGKTIVFVNDIDKCFKVKLFLERFSIRSAVLNSELPQNSRYHIVQQFNKGAFDLLIATDETEKKTTKDKIQNERIVSNKDDEDDEDDEEDKDDEEENEDKEENEDDKEENEEEKEEESEEGKGDKEENEEEMDEEDNEEMHEEEEEEKNTKRKKRRRGKYSDKEYGVVRGIDYKNVANVVNFDFPTSVSDYIHRVGRTARAGKVGLSLSMVSPSEEYLLDIVQKHLAKQGKSIETYSFRMSIIEGFRYRVEDQLRSVTKIAIKEARLDEIKKEIINSQQLKSHFEENPADLAVLKHDKESQSHKIKRHLKYVPYYLLPQEKELDQTLTPADVPEEDDVPRVEYDVKSLKRSWKKDPLKSFSYTGQKRKFSGESEDNENNQMRFKRRKKKKKKRPDKIPTNAFKPTKPKPYV